MKYHRERNIALYPHAIDGLVVGGNFAFEARCSGSNRELEVWRGERNRSGFDGVHGLIQTVERGMQRSVGGFAQMEKQVELRISGLQRAGVITLEGARLRGRMRRRGWMVLCDEGRYGRDNDDK